MRGIKKILLGAVPRIAEIDEHDYIPFDLIKIHSIPKIVASINEPCIATISSPSGRAPFKWDCFENSFKLIKDRKLMEY